MLVCVSVCLCVCVCVHVHACVDNFNRPRSCPHKSHDLIKMYPVCEHVHACVSGVALFSSVDPCSTLKSNIKLSLSAQHSHTNIHTHTHTNTQRRRTRGVSWTGLGGLKAEGSP